MKIWTIVCTLNDYLEIFYTSDRENNVATTMTWKKQKNGVKIMQNGAKTVWKDSETIK